MATLPRLQHGPDSGRSSQHSTLAEYSTMYRLLVPRFARPRMAGSAREVRPRVEERSASAIVPPPFRADATAGTHYWSAACPSWVGEKPVSRTFLQPIATALDTASARSGTFAINTSFTKVGAADKPSVE
jgi:hypothetical protein